MPQSRESAMVQDRGNNKESENKNNDSIDDDDGSGYYYVKPHSHSYRAIETQSQSTFSELTKDQLHHLTSAQVHDLFESKLKEEKKRNSVLLGRLERTEARLHKMEEWRENLKHERPNFHDNNNEMDISYIKSSSADAHSRGGYIKRGGGNGMNKGSLKKEERDKKEEDQLRISIHSQLQRQVQRQQQEQKKQNEGG